MSLKTLIFYLIKGVLVMPKAHRGKTLMSMPSRGRGTCPVCNTTRIKLLYEVTGEDEKMLKVCKKCKNKKAV